jgi:hypothetical protein
MGRETKRVPLDFDWPQGKVWQGYLMPDSLAGDDCPTCGGDGTTQAARWVHKVAYVLSGLADDVFEQERGRAMHPWLTPMREISYGGYGSDSRPDADFLQFFTGLTGTDADGSPFGSDVYGTYRALIQRAGLPDEWDCCPTCKGHGSVETYPGQRAEAEAWEWTEPPTGEGWQLWEATSEGSPSSPVFETPEALAEWCVTGATIFGREGGDYEQWLAIVKGDDFAHVQIAPGVVVM